jgi:hypothetical protein
LCPRGAGNRAAVTTSTTSCPPSWYSLSGCRSPSLPLVATVLADADESDAGIASAINNAIARVAGLVGVSIVGVVVAGTLVGDTFVPNPESVRAFHEAVLVCAALVASGGVLGAVGIINPRRAVDAERCPGGQLVGTPKPVADRRPSPSATIVESQPREA